jgi:tetratricopeptide (TPR) repeat protein
MRGCARCTATWSPRRSQNTVAGPSSADVALYLDDFATPVRELQQEAEADSLSAIGLDPHSVETWMARANALRIRRNMPGALAANDRAREVDATRYGVLLDRGFYYLDMGRPEDALKIVESVRPMFRAAPLALQSCEAYVVLAQYDRAVTECERVEDRHLVLPCEPDRGVRDEGRPREGPGGPRAPHEGRTLVHPENV